MYNANITINDENGKTVFEGSLNNLNEDDKEKIETLYISLSSHVEAGFAIFVHEH